MAEFQEQELFRGTAQSQGFAPLQAPDTSRFLRENMAQVDHRKSNTVSAKKVSIFAIEP